jgi:hypothetical protein
LSVNRSVVLITGCVRTYARRAGPFFGEGAERARYPSGNHDECEWRQSCVYPIAFPCVAQQTSQIPQCETPELRRNAVSVSTHGVHLSTYAARAPANCSSCSPPTTPLRSPTTHTAETRRQLCFIPPVTLRWSTAREPY